jgi:hypothetical protein
MFVYTYIVKLLACFIWVLSELGSQAELHVCYVVTALVESGTQKGRDSCVNMTAIVFAKANCSMTI